MLKSLAIVTLIIVLHPFGHLSAQAVTATEPTDEGDLRLTSIAHGTLMFEFAGTVIHVDPWSAADLSVYPQADWVFVTHEHGDHFDPEGIASVSSDETRVVAPAVVGRELEDADVIGNGETRSFDTFEVEAVPMYNVHHERGVGNGYVFTFGRTRVYVAGDTGCTDEMRRMTDIDIAFLPMYAERTMTPEMAAECAMAFRPGILYAYHYRDDDPGIAERMLADTDIEVRVGAPSP